MNNLIDIESISEIPMVLEGPWKSASDGVVLIMICRVLSRTMGKRSEILKFNLKTLITGETS